MWLEGVLLSLLIHFHHAENRWSCHRPLVEVTVSPLVTATSTRSLVLSWRMEVVLPGDYVALYRTDVISEPLFTAQVDSPTGWVDTGIQENRSAWESLAFTEQCLGYWVALKGANNSQELAPCRHTQASYTATITFEVHRVGWYRCWKWLQEKEREMDKYMTRFRVAASCLGTAPRWMERQRDALLNMSLRTMFLPGTHNSAAYLEKHEPFYETIVQKYAYNQDERVLNQLIYGARVLDLRVGYYPNTPELWWTNHAVIRLRPLYQVLDDIILFANMTKEIVVLDFHHFPVGFQQNTRSTHQALVRYLEKMLDGYLVPPSLGWSAPLSLLWQSGRRIVLSYNYQSYLDTKFVWPRITHKWGNVRSVTALQQYLANVMKKTYSYPWSAMVELTPAPMDVFTGQLGSLRQIGHQVNKNVTDWFRRDWGSICNIVSIDFLRGSGLVRSALDWNLRRARGSRCDL